MPTTAARTIAWIAVSFTTQAHSQGTALQKAQAEWGDTITGAITKNLDRAITHDCQLSIGLTNQLYVDQLTISNCSEADTATIAKAIAKAQPLPAPRTGKAFAPHVVLRLKNNPALAGSSIQRLTPIGVDQGSRQRVGVLQRLGDTVLPLHSG